MKISIVPVQVRPSIHMELTAEQADILITLVGTTARGTPELIQFVDAVFRGLTAAGAVVNKNLIGNATYTVL